MADQVAILPTARQILSAMSGRWDRTDPYIQVLRCAWMLARFDDWFTPGAIIQMEFVDDGDRTVAHHETGATVLQSLGLELGLVSRQSMLDRIADEVGGDLDFAETVNQLAIAVAAVHRAQELDQDAVNHALDRLGDIRGDYERRYQDFAR